MYEDTETVSLLGHAWKKKYNTGQYWYRRSTNGDGREVTRDKTLREIRETVHGREDLNLEWNGYEGTLIYDEGRADIEIDENAVFIRSEEELGDLLEPRTDNPFK